MMAIDHAPARICDLPATYRGEDVDHGRGADRGGQVGRLAIDEDVDVRPQSRPGLQEPVADARDLSVEAIDQRGDGLTRHLVLLGRPGKERDEGGRE